MILRARDVVVFPIRVRGAAPSYLDPSPREDFDVMGRIVRGEPARMYTGKTCMALVIPPTPRQVVLGRVDLEENFEEAERLMGIQTCAHCGARVR